MPVGQFQLSPGSRSAAWVNEMHPCFACKAYSKAGLEYALQAKPDIGLATQGTLCELGFAALNPGLI